MLRILVAYLTCAASSAGLGQELRLEITGRRNPLNDNIFPVIFGKLENNGILIGDLSFQYETTPNTAPLARVKPNELDKPTRPPAYAPAAKGSNRTTERNVGAASFSVKNIDDPQCLESKNVREILFLIGLLKNEIERISVSSPRNTDCLKKLSAKLAGLKPLEQDTDPLKDKIRVRLHFARTPVAEADIPTAQSPLIQPPDPDARVTTPSISGSTGAEPIVLTINGETVQPGKDGWFVYEPGSTDAQIISVRQGRQNLLLKSLTPTVLKAGTTERKTSHFRYIFLVTNAALPVAAIMPERLDLKNIVNLSLPFFLKVSYGNTRLYPLPGEGKVDRPTALAGFKSHPILYGMHVEADGFVSYKTDSQIPWTTLVTGVIGNDFMELGDNLSVPWGVGARAFKSKIDNTKASSADESESARGRILIPESVLGPAASIGIRYRNNYVYTDATVTVTPLKLPGSELIVTYNPSIYLGYQLTGADSITLNYQTHDVRFPTKTKIVQVTASIAALGYVRDLQ